MSKKLWMSIYNEKYNAEVKWYVEIDLNKLFEFKELNTPNGKRLGFRQFIKHWWQFWR